MRQGRVQKHSCKRGNGKDARQPRNKVGRGDKQSGKTNRQSSHGLLKGFQEKSTKFHRQGGGVNARRLRQGLSKKRAEDHRINIRPRCGWGGKIWGPQKTRWWGRPRNQQAPPFVEAEKKTKPPPIKRKHLLQKTGVFKNENFQIFLHVELKKKQPTPGGRGPAPVKNFVQKHRKPGKNAQKQRNWKARNVS